MAEDLARSDRPRLGRGLAALLGAPDGEAAEFARGARKAPIEFLRRNPRNIRKRFDEAELEELAASIRERGVIQPIVVRAIPRVPDAYEIIAGERRWRAGQLAGLHQIPVVVVVAGDREALEIAIVENVQRADLIPLEEAAGYAQLSADYGYSHADIARVVGKSRSHVCDTLRLTNLPEHTRAAYRRGADFRRTRARALLAVAEPDALADRIVSEGMSVRDVERLSEQPGKARRPRKGRPGDRRRYPGARGQAGSGPRSEGDDLAYRRKRRTPHLIRQFRTTRRFLPPLMRLLGSRRAHHQMPQEPCVLPFEAFDEATRFGGGKALFCRRRGRVRAEIVVNLNVSASGKCV